VVAQAANEVENSGLPCRNSANDGTTFSDGTTPFISDEVRLMQEDIRWRMELWVRIC
jgi:hypothetical protein